MFDSHGSVVTNAHVLEGEINVSIYTKCGQDLSGFVIGSSNITDIAVIHVPELIGQNPFPISMDHTDMVGQKIIALGTPSGIDNISSTGYVVGETVNLTIGSYFYEDLYQITSPISLGSSGGPLIAKNLQKIIAINTAQDRFNKAIGLSIPLYMLEHLITSWIREPMSEKAIYTQFSNDNKLFVYY